MRVLGIDCGTERTGWGVVESDGRKHVVLAHGVIRLSPRDPLQERLAAVATGMRSLLAQHAPEAAAVEEVFYSQNVKTALKLAHVRGVVLAAIADLPASEADSVWNSLRNLRAVDFNTSTVSFDPQTGSAVVQARLTPKKGKPTFEREVLVQRNGLWFLYTSLPGGSPT